jgi:glutamine amidotransferase-like uncharacterized protein
MTISNSIPFIKQVLVYRGHEKHPLLGPYPDNIQKRIAMFDLLNQYRAAAKKPLWRVKTVAGEQLIDILKKERAEETLLVFPAGQSTRLDKVFTTAQTTFLQEEFFRKGGRGYFTCGSAYWVSAKRIYQDLCEEQPESRLPIMKTTQLPLFQGIAEGPLCPFPGKKYQVGFYSDAVRITDNTNECSIYLSGGGGFILPQNSGTQKIRTLARYLPSELQRLGKKENEQPRWENAAIMASVDQGAVLLAMFHPYYGARDIDVELYERVFPDCGTNWREVHRKLSPLDMRMRFVLHSMLDKLEEMDFGI